MKLMRKELFLYVFLSIITIQCYSQSPVADNGRLQVIDHQLCSERGIPYQLRGMSMFGLMHMPECIIYNSFKLIKEDWAASVIRIPVLMANYSNSNNYNQNLEWNNALIDTATSSMFLRTMKHDILNKDTVTISWCNFSYGDKEESTSALKPGSCKNALWNNTTPQGEYIKYWIKNNNAPGDSILFNRVH